MELGQNYLNLVYITLTIVHCVQYIGYTLNLKHNVSKEGVLCTVSLQCSRGRVESILYLYYDQKRDIRSNIASPLRKLSRANPNGFPEGKRLYLTKYPESSHNMDSLTILMMVRIPSAV